MSVAIPPALFYGIGIALTLFGAGRAYYLGWRQRPGAEDEASPEEGSSEEGEGGGEEGREGQGEVVPERKSAGGQAYKRHLAFGILYVVMGLFLIISTAIKAR